MTKHFKPRITRGVPGGISGLPIVAVVGRPNVGKSTLFNRLARKKLAIVHDEPGVTRDRHYADTHAFGREYTLVDTGGFDPEDDDPMRAGIARHVKSAIEEADVIIFVTDSTAPLTAADKAAIALLRRTKKPVFYAANKADSPRTDSEAYELFAEGVKKIYPVSALHGRGLAELEGDVVEAFGDFIPPEENDAVTRISLIGRPNAGKSSLMNRLLGEERMMVDPRPGTTRDAIDAVVTRGDETFVFVDTAGIRKKGRVTKADDAVESLSVLSSIRSIERSSVVILLADAAEGVAEQDAKILGLADDRGRAMIIALNKCDLLERDARKRAADVAREKISFAPFVPVVEISAKTGRGISELFSKVSEVSAAYHKRVGTGELNRFFAEVLEMRPPPTQGGKAPRLYYITQALSAPPTFVIVSSAPEAVHFSYRRFVVNQLRKKFGFDGVPIRVYYKEKRRGRKKEGEPSRDELGLAELEAARAEEDAPTEAIVENADASPNERAAKRARPKRSVRPMRIRDKR